MLTAPLPCLHTPIPPSRPHGCALFCAHNQLWAPSTPHCCRAATAVGVLTIIGLAIFSFNNPLAFYWVLLILALQRGPILPCQEELTAAEDAGAKNTALALYVLPLLMLLPYPIELLVAMQNMPDPIPF